MLAPNLENSIAKVLPIPSVAPVISMVFLDKLILIVF